MCECQLVDHSICSGEKLLTCKKMNNSCIYRITDCTLTQGGYCYRGDKGGGSGNGAYCTTGEITNCKEGTWDCHSNHVVKCVNRVWADKQDCGGGATCISDTNHTFAKCRENTGNGSGGGGTSGGGGNTPPQSCSKNCVESKTFCTGNFGTVVSGSCSGSKICCDFGD